MIQTRNKLNKALIVDSVVKKIHNTLSSYMFEKPNRRNSLQVINYCLNTGQMHML